MHGARLMHLLSTTADMCGNDGPAHMGGAVGDRRHGRTPPERVPESCMVPGWHMVCCFIYRKLLTEYASRGKVKLESS